MSFTRVSEIGEFGLIDRLYQTIQPTEQQLATLKKGIGDDCAVIDLQNGKYQVISTDLLLEHIHFDLLTTPLEHLGAKAISVNVSDICAMNARPLYATVSVALSEKISVEMMTSLYSGIKKAAEQYHIAIVGGDTSASTAGLVISVTVVGEVEAEHLVYRSGASAGDLICVTGDVGRSYAGLKVLMRERQLMLELFAENPDMDRDSYKPDFSEYQSAIEKHLLPKARLDIIKLFAEKHLIPTAMIDISDGLGSEIKHICQASGTGALLEENRIPILSEVREIAGEFEDDALTYALFGGEDYELCFTIRPSDFPKIETVKDISVIGCVQPKAFGLKLRDIYGREEDLSQYSGFEHFAKPQSEDTAADSTHEHQHDYDDDEDDWSEDKS
ncbi:MAG: thiamine-phosphate kinase [Candidatus Thermochlorobacter sp.]